MAAARERTFIMVKPDAVQRGIVGEIIKRFEQKGFKLVALKFMWVSEVLIFNFTIDKVAWQKHWNIKTFAFIKLHQQ